MTNKISESIKRYRLKKGFSQDMLANLVGVTKSTISQWELGKSTPKSGNLLKLDAAFGDGGTWRKEDNAGTHHARYITVNICEETSQAHPHLPKDIIVQKNDLPMDVNCDELIYTSAIGDSMKPVLEDHSIIVVDKTKRTIVDGKMYLFLEEGVIRVKILSYSKGNVKASAYSDTYCDENYTMSEFKKNKIIGQIILYSTKVD